MIMKNIIMWAAIIYGIFEIAYGIRSRIGLSKNNNKDKGSYLLIVLSMVLGFVVSFQIYYREIAGQIFRNSIYPLTAGALIFVIGIIIRVIAIFTLKNQFTVSITIFEEHKMIDSGIYHYVRHPAYLGQLLIVMGFGITMNNWLCICFMIIPILFALLYRIHVEEMVLLEKFGSSYMDYMQKTKGLLPFIY